MAESFVDTFKTELISDRVWRTRDQLELGIVEWVGWYNHRRLHGELGDIPPVEYELAHALNRRAGPRRMTRADGQRRYASALGPRLHGVAHPAIPLPFPMPPITVSAEPSLLQAAGAPRRARSASWPCAATSPPRARTASTRFGAWPPGSPGCPPRHQPER